MTPPTSTPPDQRSAPLQHDLAETLADLLVGIAA
jgi:hypothetical protein